MYGNAPPRRDKIKDVDGLDVEPDETIMEEHAIVQPFQIPLASGRKKYGGHVEEDFQNKLLFFLINR